MGDFSWSTLALLTFGIQWLAYIPAAILQTEHFYDLMGTVGFVTGTVYTLVSTNAARSQVALAASTCVLLWALRLGTFLFSRVSIVKKDVRFDKIKVNPVRFFVAWTLQALWIFLTALPVYALNARRGALADAADAGEDEWVDSLGPTDGVLLAVWLAAFVLEVVADVQKLVFKLDSRNADSFITTGLWSLCRHPNYLGEMMMWFVLAIYAGRYLDGAGLLVVLGPVFEVFLLLRVSGIPLLERKAQERFGSDPAFLAYVNRTPQLLPFTSWGLGLRVAPGTKKTTEGSKVATD